MNRRIIALSVILLFAVSGLLFSEIRDSRTLHEQQALAKGKTVVLDNRNGNVTVTGWDRDSVDVVAEVEVRCRRRSELERTLENIRIRIEPKADRLVIEADSPEIEGGSGFWEWVFGRRIQVNINFHVRVPENSNVNLETANGNVRAEDLQGRLRLGSTNGNVEAAGVHGSVDVSTTNGNAEVNCAGLKSGDRITCSTTNGDAGAVVPADTQAEVEMSTVNGQVHCDLPVTVQGGISDRRIRGRIGQGGGSIRIGTVNGNARLTKE
jgi:DUF4097 and DUF4098 domain-containing protein YvlB